MIGLDGFRRILYVDDCKVATGVTTFDLHNEFLIFTTDNHECHFFRTNVSSVNSDPCGMQNLPHSTIDCTRKWIGNAAYIVYVTSLAILRTVTARGKLAGVTNDKKICASIAVCEPCLGILKLSYFLHKHQMKATKNSQAYTVGTHGCV